MDRRYDGDATPRDADSPGEEGGSEGAPDAQTAEQTRERLNDALTKVSPGIKLLSCTCSAGTLACWHAGQRLAKCCYVTLRFPLILVSRVQLSRTVSYAALHMDVI